VGLSVIAWKRRDLNLAVLWNELGGKNGRRRTG